jgi:hypothetical protein
MFSRLSSKTKKQLITTVVIAGALYQIHKNVKIDQQFRYDMETRSLPTNKILNLNFLEKYIVNQITNHKKLRFMLSYDYFAYWVLCLDPSFGEKHMGHYTVYNEGIYDKLPKKVLYEIIKKKIYRIEYLNDDNIKYLLGTDLRNEILRKDSKYRTLFLDKKNYYYTNFVEVDKETFNKLPYDILFEYIKRDIWKSVYLDEDNVKILLETKLRNKILDEVPEYKKIINKLENNKVIKENINKLPLEEKEIKNPIYKTNKLSDAQVMMGLYGYSNSSSCQIL